MYVHVILQWYLWGKKKKSDLKSSVCLYWSLQVIDAKQCCVFSLKVTISTAAELIESGAKDRMCYSAGKPSHGH